MIQNEHSQAAIVFHRTDASEKALLDAVDAGAIANLTKEATGDQIIGAVRRASTGEVLIPVGLFASAIARQRGVAIQKREREELLAEFTPRESTSGTCSPKAWTRSRCPSTCTSLRTPSNGTCVT
jgi:DNA-binding NarL/FixJ family response regulator